MPNILIKAFVGVAVLSSITTGSYFLRGYYNVERISHRIIGNGMTLLTYSDNEEEWAKRWKEYLEDKENNKWKLSDFQEHKNNKTKAPNSFKNKCLSNAYLEIEGNLELISQTRKFCTKSFKISSLLKKEKGINLLTKGQNEEKWKKAYQKNYSDYLLKKNDPLGIDIHRNNYESSKNTYQNKCDELSQREVKAINEENYIKVRSYCTYKEN